MADPTTTPDINNVPRINLDSRDSSIDTPPQTSTERSAPRASPEVKVEVTKKGLSSPGSGKEVPPSYSAWHAEHKPTRAEVLGWYLYDLCSYFIQTALIPIVFPLVISEIKLKSLDELVPSQGWGQSFKGLPCLTKKEMKLYLGLTEGTIWLHDLKVSPLAWVSASWVIGLILAAPLLAYLSIRLDRGPNYSLVVGAATLTGGLFCLPTGFFRTAWIFPPYIAAIVIAHTITTAAHTRYLSLMIRGYTGPKIPRRQFHNRRAISSLLSLYAAAAGSLGAAIISAFTYHMLQEKTEQFVSLWVVSIFSGIKWLAGVLHVVTARPGPVPPSSTPVPSVLTHLTSIFSYPHALGSIIAAFLSSFTTMCIFTGAVLFFVGQLCIEPLTLLYFWLTYFIFPLISLPLLHPLQQLIRSTAVKMQVLGFALSLITSGIGFYYRNSTSWSREHILLFAACQGTSVGILHAFGRVLVLDSSPRGNEGAFAAWHSWAVSAGRCVGFAVAATVPGRLGTACKVAFSCGAIGIMVLIFGNVSDIGGASAAGHVRDEYDGDDDEDDDEEGRSTIEANSPNKHVIMKEPNSSV